MPDSLPKTTTTPTKPDLKHSAASNLFSFFTSRRASAISYFLTFAFVACTFFLVLNPSGNYSFWFKNIFRTSFYSNSSSSYRSHYFSSFFYRFFPNSSLQNFHTQAYFSPPPNTQFQFSRNSSFSGENDGFNGSGSGSLNVNGSEGLKGNVVNLRGDSNSFSHEFNHTSVNSTPQSSQNEELSGKVEESKGSDKSSLSNGSNSLKDNEEVGLRNNGTDNGVLERPRVENNTALVSEGSESNGTSKALPENQRKQSWFEMMNNCNFFDGYWVRDDSYPLYPPGSCPHIDEPFDCFHNGRPESGYEKYRWQPKDCNVPRLNGSDMLGLLRGKRLVFVGDSLNRNMWESLVCVLRNSVEDKSRVFEASGRLEFRTEGSYSFIFKDYNCSVEFFRSPFLVQEWEMPDMNGSTKETLRLDVIERSSDRYKNADVLIFNTGHWWTHEKTSKGKDYYQEGSRIYGKLNVKEAFRKALTTWARWVDVNVNSEKTLVFFRGYSPNHFRGGQWNSGGQCDGETQPIKDEAYLAKYPRKMTIFESVLQGMKTPVFLLNITRMTDFRKDAHPSIYRKQNLTEEERRSPLRYQDCSHWCLPGVPDTWNELVYAQLVFKLKQKQQSEQHQLQKGQQKRP